MLSDLPYQGAIKLHGTRRHIPNQNATYENTSAPSVQEETFPHEEYDMPYPSIKHTISDILDLVSYPNRGTFKAQEEARDTTKHIQTNKQNTQTDCQSTLKKNS